METGNGTIRRIVWHELFPWLMLVRAIRLAFSPKVLILAMIGLLGVTAGWRIVGELFSGTADQQFAKRIEQNSQWPWEETETRPKRLAGRMRASNQPAKAPLWRQLDAAAARVPVLNTWLSSGPVSNVFHRLADPFVNLFRSDLTVSELAYYLLCCLWASLVWAISGGAITRIAALSFTREEPLGLFASIGQASKRWPSYFAAPLLPLLGTLFVILLLALGGLLMRANLLLFVGGLMWFLVLAAGLFLALILLALVIGWPLMWPAISTEGTDAFDALSRCFAYVYQRPIYYLFLIALSSILGILGFLFVGLFVDATIYLADLGTIWGTGAERMNVIQDWSESGESSGMGFAGASAREFWIGAMLLVKPAFQVGFFWVAATGVYLLLRRAVDSAELDEITLDETDAEYEVPPMPEEKTNPSEAAEESTSDSREGDDEETNN